MKVKPKSKQKTHKNVRKRMRKFQKQAKAAQIAEQKFISTEKR